MQPLCTLKQSLAWYTQMMCQAMHAVGRHATCSLHAFAILSCKCRLVQECHYPCNTISAVISQSHISMATVALSIHHVVVGNAGEGHDGGEGGPFEGSY